VGWVGCGIGSWVGINGTGGQRKWDKERKMLVHGKSVEERLTNKGGKSGKMG